MLALCENTKKKRRNCLQFTEIHIAKKVIQRMSSIGKKFVEKYIWHLKKAEIELNI